jgi:TPP-dependent pyruvate/acetoin dehydrogenase alpha subunit
VCQNNAWAISTPTTLQCSAPTVAQRGVAYGMECVQVDGNDLFAMVKVVRDAAEKARQEKQPTFIEAVTYRLGDHTTADDARRYRDPEELEQWKLRDPLIRLRGWLEARKLWDSGKEEALWTRAKEEVAVVVKEAEGIAPPKTGDIFDYTYAEPDAELRRQRNTRRTSSLGQRAGDLNEAEAATDDDSTETLVSSSHG